MGSNVFKKKTWRQVAKDWKAGQIVRSVELGGISPGYEQAIQILLFEIMARWPRGVRIPAPKDKAYPPSYTAHVDKVVSELNKVYGFSGAQAGAAKSTAFQFMHYGYEHMMSTAPKDRLFHVSRNFPTMPDSDAAQKATS